MSEEVELKRIQLWYQNVWLWIGIGVAACAIALAMPFAQRIYNAWSVERKVKRAQECFAQGKFEDAILHARRALAINPKDVEATRILAKTAATVNSPAALGLLRQLDALRPGDPENLMAIAEDRLKAGDRSAAEQALNSLAETDRTSARYHFLSASLAALVNDRASAESHLVQAVKLAPAQDEYRLKLASLQLGAKSPEVRTAALQVLQEFSAQPKLRLLALRTLLADAAARGESARVMEFAEQLTASEGATMDDRLSLLAALRIPPRDVLGTGLKTPQYSPRFEAELTKLQQEAAATPADVHRLLTWMNANSMALRVPEWETQLPAEIAGTPAIAAAIADAYVRTSQWEQLKEKLGKANWAHLEFLRQAYLAQCMLRLGDPKGADVAWKQALEVAGTRTEWLELLARTATNWGWKDKSEDALWKLADVGKCPRWALDTLQAAAREKRDSARLYKLSRLLLDAEPKSVNARNHFVMMSLLTGQAGDSPDKMAATLYREYPTDPKIAATYALSLYFGGRSEESIPVFEAFPADKLHAPPIPLIRGIGLAAAGRIDQAEEYLAEAEAVLHLPEIEALADYLRLALKARALERQGDVAGAATAWEQALAAAQTRPESLETLGRTVSQWGWKERTTQVTLKLIDAERSPRWAAGLLWDTALQSGDSTLVSKAARLLLAADPKNLQARNRVVLATLWLGRDALTTQRQAEALAKENPADVESTVINALALLQQNKLDAALTTLDGLKAERAREPRAAFYRAYMLASCGRAAEAGEWLQSGAAGAQYPDEKTLSTILQFALRALDLERSGQTPGSAAAWQEALAAAQGRPEWLSVLGRLCQTASPAKAEQALSKLAGAKDCPRWAIDALWTAAEQRGDSRRLYELSRTLRTIESENVDARNRYAFFALLTDQDGQAPHRLAETLYRENPGRPEIATTYVLSLCTRGKAQEAADLITNVGAAQLREPRVAFYFGLALAASGQAEKARPLLDLGIPAIKFPEEKALLTRFQTKSVQ